MPPVALIKTCGFWRFVWLWLRCLPIGLRRFICVHPTHAVGVASSLTMMGWGVVLEGSTPFDIGNLYLYLAKWGTEPQWGAVFTLFGVVQFLHTIIIRMHPEHFIGVGWVYAHRLIALVATSLWGYISAVALLAVPITTAATVYTVLALGSFWDFARSGE